MKKVKVRVPATTANFGSGFDTVGAALKLYNEITVQEFTASQVHKLKIEIEGEGKDTLPKDERNVVYQAMKLVFDRLQITDYRLQITLRNNIPLARGLGSSAAARIGGIVAANCLCGNKFSKEEILQLAAKLEGHPDNVVPALFGGFCISYSKVQGLKVKGQEIEYTKIDMPDGLIAVLCIPEFEVETTKARKILPNKILFVDAVFNCSRVALLIASITQKKYELLKTAMEDKLHQRYRSKLIPYMEEVFLAAKNSGAFGVALSGSGSSILAISENEQQGRKIGQAMVNAFAKHKINSRYITCEFDNAGTKVL